MSPSQVAATADTRFIWSPVYVDAMVARDRNADNNATTGTGGLEQRVYALQDANWDTTAIIAATGVSGVAAGAVINRFAYTPYGEVQTLTASWTTPPAGSTPATPWAHLFQGLEFTDVTGLAYVRHRDYSATLGRFIELDPIGFSAGDNNWYRFVGNGPTGKVDPSGLYADLAIEVVSVGTGAWSLGTNLYAGAWTAAAVDFGGIVIDVGLMIVPVAPGGTGLAVKAGRAGREAAERATREAAEAAEKAARAAREAAEKAAKGGGKCAAPVRGGPYGHLPDHPSVDTGKPFTKTQKEKILAQNEARNGGQLRDDVTGEPLVRPQQHTRRVTPPDNEAQIDHVYPRSQGGPNCNSNAEVRARIHNLKKGDRIE